MAQASVHVHSHDDYDEDRVNQIKDDIADTEKQIRAARRAKQPVDDLEDHLGGLQSRLRRLEAKDPVKLKKRRIAELKADGEIRELEDKAKKTDPLSGLRKRLESAELHTKVHHAEEEAKKHHKTPWGTLTILTVLGVLAYAFFSKIPVQHRADNLLLFVGVPMLAILYLVFRKKKPKEGDSHSSSHH